MLEECTEMHTKYPAPLFDFNQNWNVLIDFSKSPEHQI
jgi:hypothetical protein